MLGPNQQRWVDALRSGQFKQGRHYLHCTNGFCCLGVAASLFCDAPVAHDAKGVIWAYDQNLSTAPLKVVQTLDLYDDLGSFLDSTPSLAALNDAGVPFSEIADLIEAKAHLLFRSQK